jgi:hypothetical protein
VKATAVKSPSGLETMPKRIVKLIEAVRTVSIDTIVEERRPIDDNRRVEAPTERTIKDPVSGKKRIREEIRIPVPSGPYQFGPYQPGPTPI